MAKTSFSELAERLGLSDDEALAIFDVDALDAIGGAVEGRPELAILADLTAEAVERVGENALRVWLRATAADGARPIELLLAHRFGAFEDALGQLLERGLVLRRR